MSADNLREGPRDKAWFVERGITKFINNHLDKQVSYKGRKVTRAQKIADKYSNEKDHPNWKKLAMY